VYPPLTGARQALFAHTASESALWRAQYTRRPAAGRRSSDLSPVKKPLASSLTFYILSSMIQFGDIRDAVRAGNIIWQYHSSQMLIERGIASVDVIASIIPGEVIEEYH
jgi:hypothetical protein